MKKQNQIRNLLGVTQQEMATMLNVSRGQWSMYECGRRDLPTHAIQLLAEIITHVQSPDASAAVNEKQRGSTDSRRALLEHLLRENEYERSLLGKKKRVLEKKMEADHARRRIAGFVAARTIAAKGSGAWPLVAPKVSGGNFGNDAEAQLLRFEIREQLLELELMIIESKLVKVNANAENTDAEQ